MAVSISTSSPSALGNQCQVEKSANTRSLDVRWRKEKVCLSVHCVSKVQSLHSSQLAVVQRANVELQSLVRQLSSESMLIFCVHWHRDWAHFGVSRSSKHHQARGFGPLRWTVLSFSIREWANIMKEEGIIWNGRKNRNRVSICHLPAKGGHLALFTNAHFLPSAILLDNKMTNAKCRVWR